MITINFNNPNSRTLTNIDIYREPVGTPIPDVPINPPIAVMDGFAERYVDNDTVLGQDYNYRFRVYKQGGETVMSDTVVLGDVSLYGPGGYEQAVNGTDTIWNLGLVDQTNGIDLLPTLTDLAAISGPGSEFLGWAGKWWKFKIGSDIYYTPYKCAIRINTDEFEAFMSRANTLRNMNVQYCGYEIVRSIDLGAMAMLFDGRTSSKWNLQKEYPRQNALAPYSGINSNASLVVTISDEMNGSTLVQRTGLYESCRLGFVYMTTHLSYEWYWKPVLKFIPKTERNYP